ncbi:DUF4870 domain-containing protein [Nonomuraea muscovyensis]
MSQDPPHPQPDDDATRRVTRSDLPDQSAAAPHPGPDPHPGSGPQPGSDAHPDAAHPEPGASGPRPGSGPHPGSGAQPGYAYGQPHTPPAGYPPPAQGYQQQGHLPPGYLYLPPGQAHQQPGGYGYGAPQQLPPHVPGTYGPRPGSDDTTMAMLSHLLGLLVSWVGPLIIYLMKKDEAPYVRDQSAEALNFQITMFIGYLVAGLLSIIIIGLFLLPIIWIVSLIFHIQAAIAANRGENYRYPISIRLVS